MAVVILLVSANNTVSVMLPIMLWPTRHRRLFWSVTLRLKLLQTPGYQTTQLPQ